MKKIVTKLLLSSLLLIIYCANALALEIEVGKLYKGETTIASSEHGVSFLMPSGWSGVLPKGGAFFIMESQNYEGNVFVGIDQMTIEGAKETMSKTIDLGDGIAFHPRGEVIQNGSMLSGEYSVSGSQKSLAGQITTIIGKHLWGISFISASALQNTKKIRMDVAKMTDSLSLVQPKATTITPQGKNSSPWNEHLSGRKLSHFFTRSGYTEEDYIWLCANGRFFKSAQSGGFGGGTSGAFQSRNAGIWSTTGDLNGGTLLLTYNNDATARYALTHEGTKLYLDGKRYFREAANCQ